MIGTTLNHYRIIEHLGSGGMGEVYAAEDLKLKRRVALKVLPAIVVRDPDRRDRFEREAQIVAALNHPNIVIVHSVELAGDVPFLTMELIEGKPLTHIIPKGGLAIAQLLPIAVALADAVAAVHQRGILHRDLKPGNVMVTSDGRVKVLDFGVAKLNDQSADADLTGAPTRSVSIEGLVVGTLAYMSPEQAEGKPVDQRSDIFSLGVLMHELATGARPFKGETGLALLLSILKDSPPWVTDVNPALPKRFGRVVMRCLAKDPRERYQTVVELRSDLEAIKLESDRNAPPATGRPVQPRQDEQVTIVAGSPLFQRVLNQARAVASTAATVLIRGESGVGKELIARRIHEESARTGPFVKVDCASIPRELFEEELFGHAGGTASGSGPVRAGRLEIADGGTLLLDHVEEIPQELQAKLLRPLQDSTFERPGATEAYRMDVRFIAATTRDLAEEVSQGRFRRDLYFRLSVFPIDVPPLRARPEDVPPLIAHFLTGHVTASGRPPAALTTAQEQRLQAYDWPGNVRELQNVVERAVILAGDGALRFDEALPSSAFSYPARASAPEDRTSARGFLTAKEFQRSERNNLVAAMEATGWKVAGADGAAAQLGMTVSKLRARVKALGIRKPDPTSLYMRLGGNRGVETFARDLFGRAIAHPQLGRFWKGRSTYGVLREERLLVAFLSTAVGGPAEYIGRDMQKAHRGLGISSDDWDAFRGILNETLHALRVQDTERQEVVAFAEGLRADIVEG